MNYGKNHLFLFSILLFASWSSCVRVSHLALQAAQLYQVHRANLYKMLVGFLYHLKFHKHLISLFFRFCLKFESKHILHFIYETLLFS